MVYFHNLHNLCIIKVQGGQRIVKQNPNCVQKDNLQKIENKRDDLKLKTNWLYESYFRDTK